MEKRGFFKRLRREIDWKDWRVRWVLTSIIGSFILSLLIAWLVPSARDVSTFIGASFASWVGGLLLTVLITLVITIAQFARPHEEVFENRARNLLRRQAGAHIDYIIPKIQEFLDPYCDEGEREMIITEFDGTSNRFRVNQRTSNRIKSYLNDMPVTFNTALTYRVGTAAPVGREDCTLSYLRVNGQDVGIPETFTTQVERPFEMLVEPNITCEIEHRMVLWIQADTEANRHIPRRFTRKLLVIVQNQLQSLPVRIVFNAAVNASDDIVINPGEKKSIISLVDMEPSKPVYDFVISLA